MATVVRMPAALAGSTEAAIQTWLAVVGEQIAVGQPLAEIETEKAIVEYAAEVGGIVARLLAEPGKNLEVGTPIAVILAPGEGDDELQAALAGAGAAAPQVAADAATASVSRTPAVPDHAVETLSAVPESENAAQPTLDSAVSGAAGVRAFASPIVRRLVRERGLGLDALVGTGPGGRIVRRDLDSLPVAPVPVPLPVAAVIAEFTDIPITGMRRAIARRLTESKSTVPHFYLSADVRVDALFELRRQVNDASGRKISVNDFVLKAVARALKKVPTANAIWMGDVIRRFHGVDLAVAVAVEGGLLTPVVRGVDAMSLESVAATVAELAERARAGRLQQHELEGGSFSVSNLGMYGVDVFSAILNPPQAGILAVGAAKQRPVVEDGKLAVGTVMTVTLSADHRVIDGAIGAQWMAAFVELMEQPVGILL